jgi:hypothetical protein
MLSKLTRTSRSMSDQRELEERVKTAQAECERLREENVRLRAMLSIHDPVLEHPAPSAPGSAPTPLPCSGMPAHLLFGEGATDLRNETKATRIVRFSILTG